MNRGPKYSLGQTLYTEDYRGGKVQALIFRSYRPVKYCLEIKEEIVEFNEDELHASSRQAFSHRLLQEIQRVTDDAVTQGIPEDVILSSYGVQTIRNLLTNPSKGMTYETNNRPRLRDFLRNWLRSKKHDLRRVYSR